MPTLFVKLINYILKHEALQEKFVQFLFALLTGEKIEVTSQSYLGWRSKTTEQKTADQLLDDLFPLGTNMLISQLIIWAAKDMSGFQHLSRAEALAVFRNKIIQAENDPIVEIVMITESAKFVTKILPHILKQLKTTFPELRTMQPGQEEETLIKLIEAARTVYHNAGLTSEGYTPTITPPGLSQ